MFIVLCVCMRARNRSHTARPFRLVRLDAAKSREGEAIEIGGVRYALEAADSGAALDDVRFRLLVSFFWFSALFFFFFFFRFFSSLSFPVFDASLLLNACQSMAYSPFSALAGVGQGRSRQRRGERHAEAFPLRFLERCFAFQLFDQRSRLAGQGEGSGQR